MISKKMFSCSASQLSLTRSFYFTSNHVFAVSPWFLQWSVFMVSHLFLVPFEIWEEDKANLRVRIFIDYPVSLCLLLQDVVHPLEG